MILLRAEWLKSEPVSVTSKLSLETGAILALTAKGRSIEAREFKTASLTNESRRYVVPEQRANGITVEKFRTRRGSRNKRDS